MTAPMTKSTFRDAPTKLKTTATIPMLRARGIAEIKAHNWSGISRGLKDLRDNPGRGRRILITYRPVDKVPVNETDKGTAVNRGQPAWVEVYAIDYDKIPAELLSSPVKLVEQGDWWHVGGFKSPRTVHVTVDNGSLYGAIIERYVRGAFRNNVLRPGGRTMSTARDATSEDHGPDVEWLELAEFYGELGRQLGDPFYAELASELAESLR